MKKFLYLLLVPFFLLSCTNYYYVTIVEDTPVYQSQDENTAAIVVIPKNSQAYITRKGKYRKIKYNSYSGYAVNPSYTSSSSATRTTTSSSSRASSSSSTSSSPKTVHVKGYTRKDGTYVKPHTRSAPKRKS